MISAPSAIGSNGRDLRGRFAIGNVGGPGNPYAKHVAEMRSALLNAVSAEDLHSIVRTMIQKAIDGDVAAGREILDRVLGRAVQAHLIATNDDSDATRDPVSMIRELRAALGVPDDDADHSPSGAEIVDQQDAIVAIDAKTADHLLVP